MTTLLSRRDKSYPGPIARLTLLSGLLATASGCLTVGTVQTANTVGKGNWELAAEGGAHVLGTSSPVNTSTQPLPVFDVAFRYGVGEHVDLGVRVGSTMLELQSKFLVTDPDWTRLAVSLAPTAGGAYVTVGNVSQGYFNVAVPLLIGIKHFDANELVFGPRLNNLFLASVDRSGAIGYVFSIGGSIGYALAVGEFFRVLPEFSFSLPVFDKLVLPPSYPPRGGYAGAIFQAKIGLLFGKRRERPAAP